MKSKIREIINYSVEGRQFELDITNDVKLSVSLNMAATPAQCRVTKEFTIEAGSFYECTIPESVEALWGPIPLETLPSGMVLFIYS